MTKQFFTTIRLTCTLKQVLLFSLIIGLYSIIPLLLHRSGLLEDLEQFSTGLETFLGLIIGVLLVFRTNRAYERWWEARSTWGTLVNVSRNLSIKLHTYLKPNEEESQEIAFLISAFSTSLMHHLRADISTYRLKLEEKMNIPAYVQHIPSYLCSLLYEGLQQHRAQGKLTDTQLLILDTDLSQFMHVSGACEKIKSTLISPSFRVFVHHIMLILYLTLPWGLAAKYNFGAIPLTIVIAYLSFALEGIAQNLEEPFGTREDDIDMEAVCQTIQKSAYQNMGLTSPGKGLAAS